MLPKVTEENCDYNIEWLGCELFLFKPPHNTEYRKHWLDFDADGLFAIGTPYFLFYFPRWFYRMIGQ